MGLKEQLGGISYLPGAGQRARFHKAARDVVRGDLVRKPERFTTLYHKIQEEPGLTLRQDEWKTPSGHYGCSRLLKCFINEGKQKPGNGPLVVMDFGGGLGYEMVQLAANRYYREIREGRVVFIVTNLGCDPMQMGKEEIRRWTRNETEQLVGERWDRYLANRFLVRFITGDANELRRKTILVQGKDIPLWGNVDLIHERLALCHGYVPEIELPMVGLMLKGGGRLLLWSKEPQHYKRVCYSGRINFDAYDEGWNLGLANLRAVGVEQQSSSGEYQVYRRVENKQIG